MIDKVDLQSVISKYYLKQNEDVIWRIKDSILSISFQSPQKNVVGEVTYNDFDCGDVRLPIYNTGKLYNLINICSGEIELDIEVTHDKPVKLHVSDDNFNVSYALANEMIISKVDSVNLPIWDVEITLTPDDIVNLVKAKKALSDIDNLIITTEEDDDGGSVCKVVFGDELGHHNKISYQLTGEIGMNNIELPFSANQFGEILNVNKDLDEGFLKLSNKGIMQLSFKNENILSIYNIIRKQESDF
jgi:hypothetical protein